MKMRGAWTKGIFIPLILVLMVGAAGCSLISIATSSEEVGGLREIPVQRVTVDIGVGSPIPVEVVAEGEWPGLCAQIGRVEQSFDGSIFDIALWATPEDPECPPDNLGLPFRIALPINMVEVADGSYTVSVNGVSTEFVWPSDSSEQSQAEPPKPWFLAYIGRDGNVWVMENGSDPRQLTDDGTPQNINIESMELVISYYNPKVSSDGSLVAVRRDEGHAISSGFDFSSSLQIVDAASGETREVVSQTPAGFDWEPGSRRLAFGLGAGEDYFTARGQVDSDKANGLSLYDHEMDSVTDLVAPERGYALYSPQWSPDGRYLAFGEVSNYEGSGFFAYYDLHADEYVAWEEAIGLYAWSPTADRVAYDRLTYTPTGDERIFISDLGRAAEFELSPADLEGYAFFPSWSPDGEHIAYFVSEVDSMIYSLRVQSVEGGEIRALGEFESVMNPAWTPDGSQLIFSAGQHPAFNIVAVDVLDGTITLLDEGSSPALASGS